jgi:hypothetical protein
MQRIVRFTGGERNLRYANPGFAADERRCRAGCGRRAIRRMPAQAQPFVPTPLKKV